MANFPPYPYGGYQPMQMPQMPMPQMAPQMPQSGQMSGGGLSPMSRPVSSREEAQACAADFSGALMIFPDLAHSRVYLKRWNMQTGAADFVEFSPVEAVAENATVPEYVPPAAPSSCWATPAAAPAMRYLPLTARLLLRKVVHKT